MSAATLGPAELLLQPVVTSTRQATAAAISVNGDLVSMSLLGFQLGRSVAVLFYGRAGDGAVTRHVTALSPQSGHPGAMSGRR